MSKGKLRIKIINGDITAQKTDVIVNAANSSLMGGGGVDGAIHRKGGTEILEECKQIIKDQGECQPGDAVMTTAGDLPSKKVVHTVGPVWHGGSNNEADILKNCYIKSLKLVEKHEFKSVSFPNISTGIYGYPKDKAVKAVANVLDEYIPSADIEVTFVCFDDENYKLYETVFT